MKRNPLLTILVMTAFMLPPLVSRAQVVVSENIMQYELGSIRLTLRDSTSEAPVPYAGVFIVAKGDSTIANFAISDTLGAVVMDKVTRGNYPLYAEQLGYKPIQKDFFFDKSVDLGIVYMLPDLERLAAAKVTDTQERMDFRGDTLEYNASAYRPSSDDVLADLLQKMPGINVSESGEVSVHGESVQKITVNGRSFFFDDKVTALNSLPASIIDKIRVFKETPPESTGLKEAAQQPTVMDVALKAEYAQGLFGNLSLRGGSAISADADELEDDQGLLVKSSGLLAAFTEKTQLTAVANYNNVANTELGDVINYNITSMDEAMNYDPDDVNHYGQVGANLNTTKVKGLDISAMVNYRDRDGVSRRNTSRTTLLDGGDMLSTSSVDRSTETGNLTGQLQIKNSPQKRLYFSFAPQLSFLRGSYTESSLSGTTRAGAELNDSKSSAYGASDALNNSGELAIVYTSQKKPGRRLSFNFDYNLNNSDGDSFESSTINEASRSISYDNANDLYRFSGELAYVEPIGQKWTLRTSLKPYFSKSVTDKAAYDAARVHDVRNSVHADGTDNSDAATLALRWRSGTSVLFGVDGIYTDNSIDVNYGGVSASTGYDDWNFAPNVNISHSWKANTVSAQFASSAKHPAAGKFIPAVNISNPLNITVGNTHLQPYIAHDFSLMFRSMNMQTFSSLMATVTGTLYDNALTSASWFDQSGARYSVPVNSQDNSLQMISMVSYSLPLNKSKSLFLSLSLQTEHQLFNTFQAISAMDGIDIEAFDYGSFMTGFWGDDDGSLFYSGKSGFKSSRTRSHVITPGAGIVYNAGKLSLQAGGSYVARLLSYSEFPDEDRTTGDLLIVAAPTYATPKSWEYNLSFKYTHAYGYNDGFNTETCTVDAKVTKTFGAFSINAGIFDILNSKTSIYRVISDNYYEDQTRLHLGRHFLVGLKWNFGKMNPANSNRAQGDMQKMVR